MAVRREVLGDEYDHVTLRSVDEFTEPLQDCRGWMAWSRRPTNIDINVSAINVNTRLGVPDTTSG